MSTRPILIISGTNRPGSSALKVARVLEGHYARAGVATDVLDLVEMPTEAFVPSVYATKPPSVLALQGRVLNAAGLHIVCPEYNGSFPGVLKYFIDLLKFPESFEHKPVAYVGESSGLFGGLRAVEQLQMVFGYRHAHAYPVRVFIPGVNRLFDGDGNLTDATIDTRLKDQVAGFTRFIGLVAGGN